MCGICASIIFLIPRKGQIPSHFEDKEYKHLTECLKRRGPDSFNEVTCTWRENFHLFCCSSVLHLRGYDISVQPFVDKENLFLWNGEIFEGPLIEGGADSTKKMSDTAILSGRMFSAETALDVQQILSSINGPYAFIFYQSNGLLWFGRDMFGRRSLLWNLKDSVFQLSSLTADSQGGKWEEVPTAGVFCLDLNLSAERQSFVIHHYPWSSSASGSFLINNIELSSTSSMAEINLVSNMSVQIPVLQPLNKSVPSDSSSSDVLCTMALLQNSKLSKPEIFQKLLEMPTFEKTLHDFETVLSNAVKRRVELHLGLCKTCYGLSESNSVTFCNHSSTGILFSGGLDSIVIACLADKYIDSRSSIDLLNVAFANKKNAGIEPQFNTPDRVTGRDGFQALKCISPCRKWNFVEVNVTDTELNLKRGQHISELLCPSCTVLDDSIGCALWFASRGEGFISGCGESTSYKSPARVLLVGMGADEQLAGYSRHRAKFKNAGWPGLIEEISLELDRIGSRNLGRDDRIIADSGVESRYPFLDETVVSFLNSLPIWMKANLNFERGVGEKLLLRLLAFKLGLTEAAVLPKRAIQFGSRIAKLENAKEKGSDVCTRLSMS